MAATRTRMAVDERREHLLRAGVRLFATRSWEEVSVDEIAAAAGVSRGLLYHYFAGKRGFYVAVIEHAVERLREVDPDPSLPPGEQLRDGLARFFAEIEAEPELHAVLRRVAPADAEAAAILERDRERFAALVLSRLPGSATVSPLARATARSWVGAVEAAGLSWLEHRRPPAAQLVEVLAEALAAAMLAAARLDPAIELPPFLAAMVGQRLSVPPGRR